MLCDSILIEIKDKWVKNYLKDKWVDEFYVTCHKCLRITYIENVPVHEFFPGFSTLRCKCGNTYFGIERRSLQYYIRNTT